MAKSGPSRNQIFFKMSFTISWPQKKRRNQSPVERRLPHLPAQSALSSAFMVKNAFKKNGFVLDPDLRILR
jgi:hypothetical protein